MEQPPVSTWALRHAHAFEPERGAGTVETASGAVRRVRALRRGSGAHRARVHGRALQLARIGLLAWLVGGGGSASDNTVTATLVVAHG